VTQQSTQANGVPNAAVEFDPSGVNAGTETPYTDPEPEPEDLEDIYHAMADAPLMVNGMPAQCYRDGIRYSGDCRELLAQVGDSLQPSRSMNPSMLSSFGIFGYWEDWETDRGVRDGVAYVNTGTRFVPLGEGWSTTSEAKQTQVPFDVPGIRRGIDMIWNNSDCRGLILDMLNAVKSRGNPIESGGNMETLFERLINGKGGLSRNQPPAGALHGGSVSGSFRENNATVHAPGNTANPNLTVRGQLVNDITTTAAELMHLAGKNWYSDSDFAEVVRDNPKWAASNWLDDYYKKPQPYSKNVNSSAYWHPVLDNLCFDKVDWSKL
jgi:hypothetical protein